MIPRSYQHQTMRNYSPMFQHATSRDSTPIDIVSIQQGNGYMDIEYDNAVDLVNDPTAGGLAEGMHIDISGCTFEHNNKVKAKILSINYAAKVLRVAADYTKTEGSGGSFVYNSSGGFELTIEHPNYTPLVSDMGVLVGYKYEEGGRFVTQFNSRENFDTVIQIVNIGSDTLAVDSIDISLDGVNWTAIPNFTTFDVNAGANEAVVLKDKYRGLFLSVVTSGTTDHYINLI